MSSLLPSSLSLSLSWALSLNLDRESILPLVFKPVSLSLSLSLSELYNVVPYMVPFRISYFLLKVPSPSMAMQSVFLKLGVSWTSVVDAAT